MYVALYIYLCFTGSQNKCTSCVDIALEQNNACFKCTLFFVFQGFNADDVKSKKKEKKKSCKTSLHSVFKKKIIFMCVGVQDRE